MKKKLKDHNKINIPKKRNKENTNISKISKNIYPKKWENVQIKFKKLKFKEIKKKNQNI